MATIPRMTTWLSPVPPGVSAPHPDELAALTLRELVTRFPMMKRVRSIVLAAKAGNAPAADLTVEEFLRGDTERLRAQTPNLGAKTISYLHRYVIDLRIGYQRSRGPAEDVAVPAAPPPAEDEPLDMTLAQFVRRYPVSTQVDHPITRAAARGMAAARMPLSQFAEGYVGRCQELVRIIPTFRRQAAEQLCLALSVFFAEQDGARGLAPISPAAFAEEVQRALPGRLRCVFEHRAGILPRRLLPELAKRLGVSHQSVRHIEGRARNVVRSLATRYRALEILDAAFEPWWRELCQGNLSRAGGLPSDGLNRPARYVLAAVGWKTALRRQCKQVRGQWLLRRDIPEAAAARAKRLEQELRSHWALPQPVSVVTRHFGLMLTEARVLALHCKGLMIEDGYALIAGAPQARRMAILDAALRRGPAPMTIEALAARVGANAAGRHLELTLANASHLALRLWDRQWCSLRALPPPTRVPLATATPALANRPAGRKRQDAAAAGASESERGKGRAGFALALRRQLLANGPLSWRQLQSVAQDADAGTVMRALRCQGDVVRGAPGIYCLHRDLKRTEWARPAWFCNERQAALFALGRRAGLGERFYPLWTPAAERGLCEWALEAAPARLFRSLAVVSAPALWPDLPPRELQFWQNERRDAAFTLRPQPNFGYAGRFAATRVLAMLIALRASGRMSWLEANRCLGSTVDSRAGTMALALLAAMGAIAPDADWRKGHAAEARRVEQLMDLLIAPLQRTGQLSWAAVAALLDESAAARAPWLQVAPTWKFVARMRERDPAPISAAP